MNEMNFSQAATLLNGIVSQMTGQTAKTAITTPQDIVSVAQTALKTGYDPLFNAISQVWSRTVFAARDYTASLNGLEMTLPQYGNAIRKLSPVASKMNEDERYKWPVAYDKGGHDDNPLGNGQSVDMYKIAKQEVVQTNFYGTAVYEQDYTIFKDQLDCAFSSADEFMRFNSMMMTERQNDKESYKESVARALQVNFIGAIIDEASAPRVVKLLSEYNALTGLALDAQTVFQPENYPAFVRWMYSRINTLASLMGERSQRYQTVLNEKPVLRHTSKRDLRVALASSAYEQIKSMAIPVTFNTTDLSLPNFESISYWQSIEDPLAIDITPVYTGADGAVKTGGATSKNNVFGIMHDRNALGFAQVKPWTGVTPLNIKGGYWNECYHANYKTISDNTEKAIVLLLE